jgi:predicted RNA polymerase sigma factor
MTPAQAIDLRMKRVPVAVKFAEMEANDIFERCMRQEPRKSIAESKASWQLLVEQRKAHDKETANKSRREMKPNVESSATRKERETKRQRKQDSK